MRRVYSYMRGLFVITFMTLLVCGKPCTAEAQAMSYTDSLWVRLGDSVVVAATDGTADKYLEFSIFIMRPNSNWNIGGGAKDTLLGNVDFYYSYNKDAFDGYPSFKSETHAAVDFSAGGTGNGSLEGKAFENAGRMLVSLRKKLPEVGGRDVLAIAQSQWIKVCRMKWKLKKDGTGAYQANLNVAWDRPATGLMTFGGYPIIDTLSGNIMKNPDPTLRIVNESQSPVWACEGGVAQFVTTAESSGDALRYIWYDSIPGTTTRPGWKEIVRTPADPLVPSVNPHENSRGTYNYRINSLGDTLNILNVPGKMDSIFVKCVVDDASIGNMAVSSSEKRLMVRDSIRVFLSAGVKPVAGIVDTVTKCAGAPAYFRLNVSGISRNELLNKNEVDTLFITCRFINNEGNRGEKYLKIVPKVSELKVVPSITIGGYPVFYWEFSVDTVGQFYISGMPGSVTTHYCDNGRALWAYDTVFIKEGAHVQLPRLTASVGEEITLDENNDDNHLGNTDPLSVSNKNTLLGNVSNFPGSYYPITYTANNKAGLDTVVYKVAGGGCEMTREVEVIDKKYLSLKVLLEGPYAGKDRQGRDSMRCIAPDLFPYNANGKVSPYNNNVVISDFPRVNGTICDWIEVILRDGVNGNNVDTVSALLRQDGVICDTAGNPYLAFKNLPKFSYYVIISHRNHLKIMSSNAIALSADAASVSGTITSGGDFTKGNAYDVPVGIPNPALQVLGGVYMMYAGNVVQDIGRGVISVADRAKISVDFYISRGYHISDLTFDGLVTNPDRTKVSGNINVQEKFD